MVVRGDERGVELDQVGREVDMMQRGTRFGRGTLFDATNSVKLKIKKDFLRAIFIKFTSIKA